MAFQVHGKMTGNKEVIRALSQARRIFFFELRKWLKNERANMLGGKDAKGKRRRGYRDILASKKLKKRPGSWSRRMSGLFRGKIPFAKGINDLKLTMGVLTTGGGHQLQRALEMLATGGTVSSNKQMPVPIYKNLRRIGYPGPWSMGSVKTGLKSKAFRFMNRGRLAVVKDGNKTLYFDKLGERTREGKYKKSALLFMGVHGIRIKKQLSGRLDFYGRFNRLVPAMLTRGQTAVNRAAKKVERVK